MYIGRNIVPDTRKALQINSFYQEIHSGGSLYINKKLMLFIEHWFCVLNAINKIKAIKYMVDGVDCYAIVLLTDYKMKYKPRTLSWKNFQKLWRERKYLVVIRMLGYMKTPDGELKDIYLNHIFTDNPKQDWISIVSNFWKNENIRKSRRCMYNMTTQNSTKMLLRFYVCIFSLYLMGWSSGRTCTLKHREVKGSLIPTFLLRCNSFLNSSIKVIISRLWKNYLMLWPVMEDLSTIQCCCFLWI